MSVARAKKPTRKAANPDRQIEIFITRKAAAHVVVLEEERVLDEIRQVKRRDFVDAGAAGAAGAKLDALTDCLRRLRDVRSRLEQLES